MWTSAAAPTAYTPYSIIKNIFTCSNLFFVCVLFSPCTAFVCVQGNKHKKHITRISDEKKHTLTKRDNHRTHIKCIYVMLCEYKSDRWNERKRWPVKKNDRRRHRSENIEREGERKKVNSKRTCFILKNWVYFVVWTLIVRVPCASHSSHVLWVVCVAGSLQYKWCFFFYVSYVHNIREVQRAFAH